MSDCFNLDDDNDGMSDADEAVAGTSPLDAQRLFEIELIQSGSTYRLSWFGVSGRYYRVDQAGELGASWSTDGAIRSGKNIKIEEDLTTEFLQFYRVRENLDDL